MNPICMRPNNYKQYKDSCYAHLHKIGVHYIETTAPENIQEECSRLQDHDLSVFSLEANFPIFQDDCLEYMRKDIESAHALGAQQLFVATGPKDLDLETCYQRFHAAGDLVADAGLRIVLETHAPFVASAEAALTTMRKVDHPQVRINWDTANIHYFNHDIDGVEELKQVIDFVASVHVKDSHREFKKWNFPTLGMGTVRFPEIFSVLADANFTGPLIMEIEGIEGEDLDRAAIHQRMHESTDYLKQQVGLTLV